MAYPTACPTGERLAGVDSDGSRVSSFFFSSISSFRFVRRRVRRDGSAGCPALLGPRRRAGSPVVRRPAIRSRLAEASARCAAATSPAAGRMRSGWAVVRISSSRLQVPRAQRLDVTPPARGAGVGVGATAGRARRDRGGRFVAATRAATRRTADAGPRRLSSEPTWSGVGGIGENRSPLGIHAQTPSRPPDRSRNSAASLPSDEISVLVYAIYSARQADRYHNSALMSNWFDFSGSLSIQKLNH